MRHLQAGLASVAGLLTLTIGLSALPAAASIGSPGPRYTGGVAGAVASESPAVASVRLGRSGAADALVLRPIALAGYSRVALPTPDASERAAVVAEPPTAPPTPSPSPPPTPEPTAPPTPAPTRAPTAKPTPKPAPEADTQRSNGCADCTLSGGFVWPVAGGEVSQGYHGGHEAIDIHAPTGTAVLAAANGEVIFSGWKDNGGGWQVWLRHGDVITTYSHMNSVGVGHGAWVGAGQQIGRVGATGWATGPHLHFEAWIGMPWQGGYPVNPLGYF
jgi:murein DD-endopeptidase MepM/ murein hydrolase activator NlpD